MLVAVRYGAKIRFGTSSDSCPNTFSTYFDIFDFSWSIQVTFGRHQHIVASGIIGNILLVVWRVTYFSAGPFLVILVPSERGGLCGHFKSNFIKIGPRSSEISSVKHWDVEKFSTFT